jgi:hypothetical protein
LRVRLVYLDKQIAAVEKTGQDMQSLPNSLGETPQASSMLKRFAQLDLFQ